MAQFAGTAARTMRAGPAITERSRRISVPRSERSHDQLTELLQAASFEFKPCRSNQHVLIWLAACSKSRWVFTASVGGC